MVERKARTTAAARKRKPRRPTTTRAGPPHHCCRHGSFKRQRQPRLRCTLDHSSKPIHPSAYFFSIHCQTDCQNIADASRLVVASMEHCRWIGEHCWRMGRGIPRHSSVGTRKKKTHGRRTHACDVHGTYGGHSKGTTVLSAY